MSVRISTSRGKGIPFSIDVQANINKTEFTIVGLGTVSVRGVYQGLLNFSELPPPSIQLWYRPMSTVSAAMRMQQLEMAR